MHSEKPRKINFLEIKATEVVTLGDALGIKIAKQKQVIRVFINHFAVYPYYRHPFCTPFLPTRPEESCFGRFEESAILEGINRGGNDRREREVIAM